MFCHLDVLSDEVQIQAQQLAWLFIFIPRVNSVLERILCSCRESQESLPGSSDVHHASALVFALGRSLELLCSRILQSDISAIADDTADPFCSIVCLGTILLG